MAPTVLITGASGGSGKATALLFASKGCDVVRVARRPERLAAAAAQVQREGTSAIAIAGDVGDSQQVRAIIQKALDACGNIDVLVNNAGICLTRAIEHTTKFEIEPIIEVFAIAQANEAMQKVRDNQVRYRAVLTVS